MASPATPTAHERESARERPRPNVGPLVVLVVVAAVPVALAVSLENTTYNTWGGFVWGPVFLLASLPLTRWVAAKAREPEIAGFLFGAAALKVLVGAVARYFVSHGVYDGGDARQYREVGAQYADGFRSGEFPDLGQLSGTRFVQMLNGMVQALIGRTDVGSYLAFSLFAFVGLCLMYLAFREALPNGDQVLFRRLLFLTPTVWFWPSSVGKEAFLTLCMGAVAYGLARVFTGHPFGVVLAGLGMWGTAVVRPHMALVCLAGGIAALTPLARQRGAHQVGGGIRRVAAIILLPIAGLVILPIVADSAKQFFGIDELDADSADDVRIDVRRQSAQGGSEFTPPDASTPPGLVLSIGTVIVRPFPWEAHNAQTVLSGIESAVLAGVLTVAVSRRGMALVRALRERWVRFALAYVITFGWGFGAVANFGIIVRQRSLMLPFLFVLVASARPPDDDDVNPETTIDDDLGRGKVRRMVASTG